MAGEYFRGFSDQVSRSAVDVRLIETEVHTCSSYDRLLMSLGFLGSIGDGLSLTAMLLVTSKLMNTFGTTATNSNTENFTTRVNQNAVVLCYMACAQWFACFLEGYCWSRTGERQASRLRRRYLKAVMRQDVGYFDLHVTSTAEVITSVSSDTLVIQDVISEKVVN
ncbi:ABC transporter B family member 15 [Forsythia ovata]|uniref:ABC transporter B family member 15 n=1 Tax=Forsythia ovata TaxID=205694 RepID=A0ABD1UUV6_9LAMI